MAVFNKFNTFVENVTEKVHNLGADQIQVALTNTAPAATNTVLADLVQIVYTFLSSRLVTTTASAQTAGVYKLTLTDLTLTASGGSVGPFRYVALYNATAVGGPLIGYYDRGSSITLLDGESVLIDFDDAGGVLTIT